MGGTGSSSGESSFLQGWQATESPFQVRSHSTKCQTQREKQMWRDHDESQAVSPELQQKAAGTLEIPDFCQGAVETSPWPQPDSLWVSSPRRESPQAPWQVTLTVKRKVPQYSEGSSGFWTSLKRAWLCFLCTFCSIIGIHWEISPMESSPDWWVWKQHS